MIPISPLPSDQLALDMLLLENALTQLECDRRGAVTFEISLDEMESLARVLIAFKACQAGLLATSDMCERLLAKCEELKSLIPAHIN